MSPGPLVIICDVEAYLIDAKVSTVNFLPSFSWLVCEKGADTLFLHAAPEEIDCLTFGFPRYSKHTHCP